MRFIVMFVTAVWVLSLIKLRWPKKKSIYDILYFTSDLQMIYYNIIN